jgi:hypothetical protein
VGDFNGFRRISIEHVLPGQNAKIWEFVLYLTGRAETALHLHKFLDIGNGTTATNL